jgi:GH24 family phage-related lysozyme (muramidase)
MSNSKDGTLKYFPHIAGSLILASAASLGMLHKWEPANGKPDAHLYVYEDKIASGTLTVCSGLTNAVSKKKLVKGDKWTQQECNENEAIALEALQNALALCFKKLPPQSTFDAATSHAWNFSVNKTCSSAAMKHFNQGNYRMGCRLIAYQYDGTTPNWSFSDGKFVQGLHNRRIDEMNLCLKDVK